MPYDDPEPDDPNMLVGIALPCDEATEQEMAAAFADEFARMGFSAGKILDLFRSPFYAGAHRAYRLLGNSAIERLVDESVRVWGRIRQVVQDASEEPSRQDEASPVNTVWKSRGRGITRGAR